MKPTQWVTVGRGEDSVSFSVARAGQGTRVLFLGGAEPMRRSVDWIEALAKSFEVIVPIHPGFGGSPFVPHIRRPADLALLYLSLLDSVGSSVVIGSSFGGWIAADMAIRSCQNISQLILMDSVGFKFADTTDNEVMDLYASPPADIKAALYSDPALRSVDMSGASDELLTHVVEDRTAEAYYGWSPYMHTPGLHRWLHRIARPTLVLWGEDDRIVPPSYGEKIAARIPNAKFGRVPQAAHYPHIENPASVLKYIQDFLNAR